MPSHEIEGTLLDSFNIAFYQDKWAIDPVALGFKVAEEVADRMTVCNKFKRTYVISVLITELEGDKDAISQRKESEDTKGVLGECAA